MPIKILVISDYNHLLSTRPEAEVLLELDPKEFEITLMSHKGSFYAQKLEQNGIRVIDFHPLRKFDPKEIAFIRKELIEGGYHILHLFNSKSIVTGIKAAKGLPVKVVLYRGYTGNIHWWDPTAYLKFLHPRVDKIVCNSIGVEKLIRRHSIFNADKCITINKGHRIEWYEQYEPVDWTQEGIPANAFVVMCVCNNRRMKGLPYLLKSLEFLPKDIPLHLVLVGRNMKTRENLRMIEQGNYHGKVHFFGYREDVLRLVASSNIFVLPSIYGESITKSVLEAMSLGIAPVITDIPGNTELVDHQVNGLVVPRKDPKALADAILRLYQNPELCKQFGQKSKDRIDTVLNNSVTIEKTAQLYRDLYNSV
ncbi:MAG: glycosyltransferase [Chitinophagaceae bacterium]|nr:glycosyltransferase [Chitinophagaceae bacterium]